MNYEIKNHPQYNSREIYFDGKPAEAVRDALNALKMRWNSVKKCWYGYAGEHELINAIQSNSTDDNPATVYTDGYMGGGAIYGSKSNRHLYGADLAAAIRQDIKAAGIKGVTIARKHGNIQATIRTTADDCKGKEEFLAEYRVKPIYNSIYFFDEDGKTESISADQYYQMDARRQENIRRSAAAYEYHKEIESENALNHYYIDRYTGFSESGLTKIKKVLAIIEAYRYDESNSMVDYFNTNFYIDIYTEPAA